MTGGLHERLKAARHFPAMLHGMTIALREITGRAGEFAPLAAIACGARMAVGPFTAAEVADLLRKTADELDGGQERPH